MSGGAPLRSGRGIAAGLLAVAVVIAGGCAQDEQDGAQRSLAGRAGYHRDPAPMVGDLTLVDYATDPKGTPINLRAPSGELLLLYFGYLSCPDVCPTTMVDVATAMQQLGPDATARLSLGFVSVDPERDDGDEIAKYLANFFNDYHALLAEDEAQLTEVAARFNARWEIETHQPGEPYDVSHSAILYVVDDQGRVVWELPFGTSPDGMAEAFADLLVDQSAA